MADGDDAWVRDIFAAIADIRVDTADTDFEACSANPVIVRSVLDSIAVIGEAAKNISPDFKAAHPDIPWRAIAGIRDRIVHEYFRTNTRRVWDVVIDDIDSLEDAPRKPLKRPSPKPDQAVPMPSKRMPKPDLRSLQEPIIVRRRVSMAFSSSPHREACGHCRVPGSDCASQPDLTAHWQ
jgi:uncharacterized protein with HEPN domain